MNTEPTGASDLHCAFCGKTKREVRKMVAGQLNPGIVICDECIDQCRDIINEETANMNQRLQDARLQADETWAKASRAMEKLIDQIVDQGNIATAQNLATAETLRHVMEATRRIPGERVPLSSVARALNKLRFE